MRILLKKSRTNKLEVKVIIIIIRKENLEKISFFKEKIEQLKSTQTAENKEYLTLKRQNNIIKADIQKFLTYSIK